MSKETIAFVSKAQIEEVIEELHTEHKLGDDWAWREAILKMSYRYYVPGKEPSNMVSVESVDQRLEAFLEERKKKAA